MTLHYKPIILEELHTQLSHLLETYSNLYLLIIKKTYKFQQSETWMEEVDLIQGTLRKVYMKDNALQYVAFVLNIPYLTLFYSLG